jgi:hypothetical protein
VHGVFSVYWTTPGCCFQGWSASIPWFLTV